LHLDGAEERAHPALEHLLDGSRPPIITIARDSDAQAIAVDHTAHLWWRQENTLLEPLDPQKAVAGAMSADRALNERT